MSTVITKLHNKKIALLGLGMENYALAKYLLKHKITGQITVCDARTNATDLYQLPADKVHWQLGKSFNKNLDKFDILFRSPGWPISCSGIKQAIANRQSPIANLLSSPIKLFFELCPTKNIIGVTGTKGKGTTSSLIAAMLKQAGKTVWLGGNIGVAPFAFIDKIKKNDWVVLEMSSFQLEDMTVSPHIAVITNFYPEHLAPADPHNPNFHKSLKDYRDAKFNIVKWQRSGDKAVLNYELRITNYELRGEILTFSARNKKANYFWLNEEQIKGTVKNHNSLFIIHTSLLGEHNKENIAAAVAVAKVIGIKESVIAKAVAEFKGLEHRLEFVREVNGVKYYNDSFATTPESTITALRSFSAPVVLLLGGADKQSDFSRLVREVKRRVKFAVLLDGQATARIKLELDKIEFPGNKMKLVYNIGEAVALAKRQAAPGQVVLLSTACASFGMFKNYKERGRLFKEEVKKIK